MICGIAPGKPLGSGSVPIARCSCNLNQHMIITLMTFLGSFFSPLLQSRLAILAGHCLLPFHGFWELLSVIDSHRQAAVANREQDTTCLITAHEVSNHNQYRYSFTVLGTQYTGISQSPTDGAVVGEQMKVTVIPTTQTQIRWKTFLQPASAISAHSADGCGRSRRGGIHWFEQNEGEENVNTVT